MKRMKIHSSEGTNKIYIQPNNQEKIHNQM